MAISKPLGGGVLVLSRNCLFVISVTSWALCCHTTDHVVIQARVPGWHLAQAGEPPG